MRLDTGGDASFITLESWDTFATSCANGTSASPTAVNLITNADQGLLASWEVLTNVTSGGSTSKSYYIANTSGGGAASQNTTTSLLTPVLQARDGTFFGTDGNGNMVRFDQTGNIMWSVGDSPQIATADGGVLGISGTTYDSNGHATGQTSLPIQSMTGEAAYQLGSIEKIPDELYPPPATPPNWNLPYASQLLNRTSPLCHDDRDQLTPEYVTYGADFVPSCYDFLSAATWEMSTLGQNRQFSFSIMNHSDITRNDHPNWALLTKSLREGIGNVVAAYESSPMVTSACRSPLVQFAVNRGHPKDRHVHGDAVDVNAGDLEIWQTLHGIGKSTAVHACVEPWQAQAKYDQNGNLTNNPWDHVHFDWRLPCPTGGLYAW